MKMNGWKMKFPFGKVICRGVWFPLVSGRVWCIAILLRLAIFIPSTSSHFKKMVQKRKPLHPNKVIYLYMRYMQIIFEIWCTMALYICAYIDIIYIYIYEQTTLFHQPRFPWNKGSHFPYNSCEVAMTKYSIWYHVYINIIQSIMYI